MVALILVGLYTPLLSSVRQQLNFLTTPFYQVTDIPRRISEWGGDALTPQANLKAENDQLRTELLIHQRKLQQMAALAAENVRLRQLLNATDMLQDKVLIAELISVSPNPLSHLIVINRGSSDGVYEGQPVLDAFGLMGQVIHVDEETSRAMLISDPTHAIPVQVNRNGVRAIAEGTGDLNQLNLRHVSINADIREGDLLVSSGLGERFPVGYPVAQVEQVIRNSGQAFARVVARPMARLDRSRHVLLVFDTHGFTPVTAAEQSLSASSAAASSRAASSQASSSRTTQSRAASSAKARQ